MATEQIQLGENVTATVSGNTLTITVDISKDYGWSSSGKTKTVASTGGFQKIAGVMVGLNVNRKPTV